MDKQNSGTLPIGETQPPHLHDDSELSAYNCQQRLPTSLTPSPEDSHCHLLDETFETAGKNSTHVQLKKLHRHSKSTLPYAETTISETPSSSSSAAPPESSSSLSATVDLVQKKGLNTLFKKVKVFVKSNLTNQNIAKQFANVNLSMIFMGALCLIALVALLSDSKVSELVFGVKPEPVYGVADHIVYTDSMILVPDVGSVGKSKNGPGALDPSKNLEAGSKKAPGDFGTDMTGEKAGAGAVKNGIKHPLNAVSPTESSTKTSSSAPAQTVFKSKSSHGPELVMVLALNPELFKAEYLQRLVKNRQAYAQKHGYGLYVRYSTDFRRTIVETSHEKKWSWVKLAIMRAAIHAFPSAKHFWYLDHTAVITNMAVDVVRDVIDPKALDSLMLRNVPLVHSEDNQISTYKNVNPSAIKFITTQDALGLATTSFIFANLDTDNGQFAKSLLDYWNDPLSRSYKNFDHAEASALNHIMQWHPVFLSRTAVVKPRSLASYNVVESNEFKKDMKHAEGDFVAVVPSCKISSTFTCLGEMFPLIPKAD